MNGCRVADVPQFEAIRAVIQITIANRQAIVLWRKRHAKLFVHLAGRFHGRELAALQIPREQLPLHAIRIQEPIGPRTPRKNRDAMPRRPVR